MIIVTGASGFIGHFLIQKLNAENFRALVAVDHLHDLSKNTTLGKVVIQEYVDWDSFSSWLDHNQHVVEFIFHLGTYMPHAGCSYTAPGMLDDHVSLSMQIWRQCVTYQIPLVYASSSAVYGLGKKGFSEAVSGSALEPVNELGRSSLWFDNWALQQKSAPFYWAGLRLFTVYGPYDHHDPVNRSGVHCLFEEIHTKGTATLPRTKPSHRKMQDFIYVKDVANICFFLMHHRKHAGLYNIGSGEATSMLDIVNTLFYLLDKKESLLYTDRAVDAPYPLFAKASLKKLRHIGFSSSFHTLEEGLRDYLSYFRQFR